MAMFITFRRRPGETTTDWLTRLRAVDTIGLTEHERHVLWQQTQQAEDALARERDEQRQPEGVRKNERSAAWTGS